MSADSQAIPNADLRGKFERFARDLQHAVRARQIEAWLETRPVVASVYRIRAGAHVGDWAVSCPGFLSEHFPRHPQAVQVAHRMAQLAAAFYPRETP